MSSKFDEKNNPYIDPTKTYQRAPGRLEAPAEGTPPPDPVTEGIRERFLSRQQIGYVRYGVGLQRPDFTVDNWLQHLEEELMDALQYTVRLRMTLDGTLPVVGPSISTVYARDECIFKYCPCENICKGKDQCAHQQNAEK